MNGFGNKPSAKKMVSPGKVKKTISSVKETINGITTITKTTTLTKNDGSQKVIE